MQETYETYSAIRIHMFFIVYKSFSYTNTTMHCEILSCPNIFFHCPSYSPPRVRVTFANVKAIPPPTIILSTSP